MKIWADRNIKINGPDEDGDLEIRHNNVVIAHVPATDFLDQMNLMRLRVAVEIEDKGIS